MKKLLIGLIRPVRRNQKGDLRIVAFCLLGSCLFWLFNALNKEYSTNIAYPIRFEYDKSEILPVSPLPTTVQLNVEGKGWNLLSSSLKSNLKPYVYHLTEAPASGHHIPFSGIYPFVQMNMDGLQVNTVITDSLNIDFDKTVVKEVQIVVDSNRIMIANDYSRTSTISVDPQVIYFTGPGKLIEELSDTVFVRIPAKNIDSPYSEYIRFNQSNQMISLDKDKILVKFDVKKK